MKNQVTITHKTLMVTFEFPIVVGQVKTNALAQAYVGRDSKSGEITGDFEFMDQENTTYMDMPVRGFDAWKKLKEFHLEFGVDLQKLIDNKFDEVVTENFKKEFLKQFDSNIL